MVEEWKIWKRENIASILYKEWSYDKKYLELINQIIIWHSESNVTMH